MAVETSISKLQKQVDKLEKENLKLRDLLAERKEKQKYVEESLKYYKKNIEKIINDAVEKATKEIIVNVNIKMYKNGNLSMYKNGNELCTG